MNKFEEKVKVLCNERLAPSCYRLELLAPRCASTIAPGQFVHLQVAPHELAMLRRPFSVFDVCEENDTITIMYEVKGKGTVMMTSWGETYETSVLAPLGNTWANDKNPRSVLLVGGGFGGAPLYMLAKRLLGDGAAVKVVLGAKIKETLILSSYFEKLDLSELVIATDDGSAGWSGFCTEPAIELMESDSFDYVATCGPAPVMKAIASAALKRDIDCEVSTESFMACGVGACKTCVVESQSGKVKACECGPIFDARCLKW